MIKEKVVKETLWILETADDLDTLATCKLVWHSTNMNLDVLLR